MTKDDWRHTNFQKDEQFECFSTLVQIRNQFCLLAVSLSRGTGVIFVQTLEHCSFLTRSRRNVATHSCTGKRVCSFVKGMMVAPLSTAGVSDEVAQELQMAMGPQMLEDVEEPMPARPTTLRDPGTPDQIVMEQHSPTHFPSQPWCKMCVESRGHDSPHREQSKIDAVVPQLQFDYGYMGDGGPLQIACFLVGADTSSGAIHATMVPDSKKMDMPYVVEATAIRVRDLVYERFCLHGDQEGVLQLLLDKVAKECRTEGQDGKFYDKYHRHRAIRARAQLRKQSPQCVDSPEHIWQFSKTKSHLLK